MFSGPRSTAVVSDKTGPLWPERPIDHFVVTSPRLCARRHGLCSFFRAKLYEDVLDVRLNRFKSNGEVPCDFLVVKALGDKLENGTHVR
jgi:hypothetical protein